MWGSNVRASDDARAISRRTLARGAAWSAPVLALSVAAPAFAASGPCTLVKTSFNNLPTGDTPPLLTFAGSAITATVAYVANHGSDHTPGRTGEIQATTTRSAMELPRGRDARADQGSDDPGDDHLQRTRSPTSRSASTTSTITGRLGRLGDHQHPGLHLQFGPNTTHRHRHRSDEFETSTPETKTSNPARTTSTLSGPGRSPRSSSSTRLARPVTPTTSTSASATSASATASPIPLVSPRRRRGRSSPAGGSCPASRASWSTGATTRARLLIHGLLRVAPRALRGVAVARR